MALLSNDLTFLRSLVRERSGIVLGEDKAYLLESRLNPLVRVLGLTSLEVLVRQLRSNPPTALVRQVVEAMTTNETLFFRDTHPFETLTTRCLPELMAKRQTQKRLTIWCAASSTGQEPYSIAIAIREQLPQLSTWDFTITATDLSTEVLAKAKAGAYSQLEVSRGLSAQHLQRWFAKTATGTYQIKDELRRMVDYKTLNLLESWNVPAPLDVVFMRNVLIYFDLDTKKQILAKVRRVLAPDGFFFLGGAETTMNIDDHFERLPNERGGCYRLKAAAAGGA